EAERLASLNVDLTNFQSEREVVKEEFRQNYVAPPYGKLSLLVDQKSFTRHPYRRPGIGNIDELDAARLPDVQAFHATYYRPDNATLVVAGDFDAGQLDRWVDQYFAPIPRPDRPLPRVTVKEPERTREARMTEYAPNVPLPALVATYLVPPAASSDAYVLRIADTILSGGASSRLYRALVYEQQVATLAVCNADLREDISLFTFRVVVAGGKKIEEAERALLAEVGRLQAEPAGAAELEKAKNQLITSQLRKLETPAGKANLIGYSGVVLGDPDLANRDIERLQQVTAADVRRVMQKYFTEANRVVIHYLARPENREAGEPREGTRK
ncbi:MAG: insulinase family protein, partial [Acidobacteria bacterium]|nr:insulinase family protein [Acidobacteriota bacterium]